MAITQGTWGNLLGPLGNLDFGITEALGIGGNNPNQAPSIGPESGLAGSTITPISSNSYQVIPQANGQSVNTQISSPSQGLPSSGNTSSGGSVNQGNLLNMFPGYAGWNPADAWNDYLATGGAGKGGSSSGPSYNQQMIDQINSGYNNYFGQLDQMLGGLSDQGKAQEAQIGAQYSGNLADLGLQKEANMGNLNTQEQKAQESQVKSLKDISNNIRNLMQAGNTYLGAKGAGDSSAVNQYGYALTKLGSQQRGDVMSQTNSIVNDINDRRAKLDNVYLQEKNRLNTEKDSAIQGVAQWLADAQNQIRQARAQGELAKSSDLQSVTQQAYQTALQQLNNVQNFFNNRQQQLESWALNNSNSLAEAKSNLAGISSYLAPTQTYSQISGVPQFDSQGNLAVDLRGGVGGGLGLSEEQKRLLGLA